MWPYGHYANYLQVQVNRYCPRQYHNSHGDGTRSTWLKINAFALVCACFYNRPACTFTCSITTKSSFQNSSTLQSEPLLNAAKEKPLKVLVSSSSLGRTATRNPGTGTQGSTLQSQPSIYHQVFSLRMEICNSSCLFVCVLLLLSKLQ